MSNFWVHKTNVVLIYEFFSMNRKIRINYSSTLYKFYDAKLTEISKSIVMETCANIKRLDVPDDQCEHLPNIDDVNMGTTLFELYLILKRFQMLGELQNILCSFYLSKKGSPNIFL